MKETIKKLTLVFGFIPAFIMGLICIIFFTNKFYYLPLIFITIIFIHIPLCLQHAKMKKIGFILLILLSLVYFGYALIPSQSTPNTTAFLGIFFLIYFLIYYYILKIW